MRIRKKSIAYVVILLAVVLVSVCISVLLGGMVLVTGIAFLLLNRSVKAVARSGAGGDMVSERNFDKLLLGSTEVWKCFSKGGFSGGRMISFAFYKRSLYTDFLVLKHRFSYLADGGQVLITVDCKDLDVCSSRDLHFADTQLLHSITLERLGIDHGLRHCRSCLPILFCPMFSMGMLISKIASASRIRRSGGSIGTRDLEDMISVLSEMVEFCLQRDLVPRVFFVDFHQGMRDVAGVWEAVSKKYRGIELHVLSNVSQLRDVM